MNVFIEFELRILSFLNLATSRSDSISGARALRICIMRVELAVESEIARAARLRLQATVPARSVQLSPISIRSRESLALAPSFSSPNRSLNLQWNAQVPAAEPTPGPSPMADPVDVASIGKSERNV